MRAPSPDANRAPSLPSPVTRRAAALGVSFAGLLTTTACPSAPPVQPVDPPRVRVTSFTEATPVRHILGVPPFAFAATSAGLDRWDLRSGQALHLGLEHGLPGERVQSLDYDLHGELWIATDAGLVRYDVEQAAFRAVRPPPAALGVDSFEGASISATPTGAWVGLRRGLFHVSRDGVWAPTDVTAPVTDLYAEPDEGDLWIGTAIGLFVLRGGLATPIGPDQGCDLTSVRFVAGGPDGRPVAVGQNRAGQERIALVTGGACDSYWVSPDETWVAAASRPGELLVLTDRRLYSMRRPGGSGGRALVRDGMQLLPVPRGDGGRPAPSPFILQSMSGELPAGAQALAAVGDEVLVGTRSLGTARVVSGRRALQWLRRGELMGQATSLSVACARRDDCYVATGSARAWRFDGERFSLSGGGERRALAVARGPGGRIVGLRQSADGRSIALADIHAGEWRETGVTVETPGRDPELAFARFSPAGILWLGLRYRDDAGELRPHGVALVDVAAGLVTYHHAGADEAEPASDGPDAGFAVHIDDDDDDDAMPIPMDVGGIAFAQDGGTWLASSQGAVEVEGDDVAIYGQSDGLRSELLRGVAWSDSGLLYFAAGGGVGVFDGETWRYPRELGLAVNDMEIGPDDRLWMATDRGLAVYEAGRVRHFDARRGLVENRIEDIALDQFGRVWLRGPQSLGIVAP
ncbi:MAG TPA: hypothetical protein VK698_14290 [Kofleriaceae bacterium]|nr:hypothetical protein [Kofleriaceae bacterium]